MEIKQNSRTKLMGEDKISKALITLAIPAIIGMLVNAIYNLVDTMFVGRLGTSAIGAATVVFPLFMLIGAFGLTFGVGSGSYVSRLLGKGEVEQASRTASTAVATTAVAAIFVTALCLVFIEPILRIFGATPTIMPYAIDYARIIVAGAMFTMLNMCMNNLLRAEGSAKMSMVALVIGAGLNIILDPIFIFAFGMGIKGAAVATVVSQIVSTIFLLNYYLRGHSVAKLSPKLITPSKEIYSEILKIGLPTFARQILVSVAMALFNIMAMPYGDATIAGIGIVNRVFTMAMYVLFGFVQGFVPLAGYNYGAKKYDRLLEALKVSLIWTTIYSLVMAAIYVVFAKFIVMGFSSDPTVIAVGSKGLRMFSMTLPFAGILVIVNGLFQSMGKARQAGVLSLSRQGFFLIPLLYILPQLIGVDGIFLSQPIADFLTLIITIGFGVSGIREIKSEQANTKSLSSQSA